MKKCVSIAKRTGSLLLTVILSVTILSVSDVGNSLSVNQDRIPSTVEASSTLHNPDIVKNDSMAAEQKVTWDCVWFGSYPQTEVVLKGSESETKLEKEMNSFYETKYESVDSSTFAAIQNASYDSNENATVDGVKYRRMKMEDATYRNVGYGYNYEWGDPDIYHYFKYEPIKWRILNIDDEQLFLFSDEILDCQIYHPDYEHVTWEISTIRSWMNGYGSESNQNNIDYSDNNFFDNAFHSEEQESILEKDIENNDNLQFGTEGGNGTKDKVFLLSETDVWGNKAEDYGFVADPTIWDEARMGRKSTSYAFAMGTSRSTDEPGAGNSSWWLRSPGSSTGSACEVTENGWGINYGMAVENCGTGVRPALYLDITSDLYSYAGTVCSDGTVEEVAKDTEGVPEKNPENVSDSDKDVVEDPSIDADDKLPSQPSVPSEGNTAVKEENKSASNENQNSLLPDSGAIVKDTKSVYTVATAGATLTYKAPINKKAKKVTIPATVTIDGITYKVTDIAPNAFKGCKKLKKITIGTGITTIGKKAFAGCKNIKNIIVKSKSLKKIGKNAFKGINKAAKIKVPKNKLKAYKKLFKKAKLAKSIKVTK